MTFEFVAATGTLATLDLLRITTRGPIVRIELNRPKKRNAVSDGMVRQLQTAFTNLPDEAQVAIVGGVGEHFSAGLDLSELSERSVTQGIAHSRMWHAAMEEVQFCRVPVIAVLQGAVIGGGIELATATHIRVAEKSTFYALPEGQRGIFVGGGASARLPRLIGAARMADMMLTARVLNSAEGHAAGLAQYLVEDGTGFDKAVELAERIAKNAPLSNYAVIQALPRIADMSRSDGLFVESLMAGIAQGDDAAKERMRAFLERSEAKVKRPEV